MILDLGGGKLSARLRELAPGGACIEVDAVPLPHAALTLRWGASVAKARIAWVERNRIGLAFQAELTAGQIEEQIRRTALKSRCRARPDWPMGGLTLVS